MVGPNRHLIRFRDRVIAWKVLLSRLQAEAPDCGERQPRNRARRNADPAQGRYGSPLGDNERVISQDLHGRLSHVRQLRGQIPSSMSDGWSNETP
jgi:hypothetical protein